MNTDTENWPAAMAQTMSTRPAAVGIDLGNHVGHQSRGREALVNGDGQLDVPQTAAVVDLWLDQTGNALQDGISTTVNASTIAKNLGRSVLRAGGHVP